METKLTERELAEQRDANVAAMIASGNAIQREIAKQALDAKQAIIDELVDALEDAHDTMLEDWAGTLDDFKSRPIIAKINAALAKARGGNHA